MADQTIKGMRAPELHKLLEETIININAIKKALEDIDQQKKQAADAIIEISGDETNKGYLDEIKEMQTEADEKLNLIKQTYDELFGDSEDESDKGMKGELDSLIKEFESTQEKIKSAEQELYGYDKKTTEGEETHIDGLVERIQKFFDTQKKKYTETYDKIENELLAGATTVGLSKAYDDKAKSYDNPNKFWLAGFFILIGLIILCLYLSLKDINEYFTPAKIQELATLSTGKILAYFIVKLIIRIGIISSLIWAASFAGKRYSQNKRLAEEYSYKSTVAKSFEGYRKKAEELDQLGEDKGLSEKLMDKMIQMSAFNPVTTMESNSHTENHPTTAVLEKSLDSLGNSIRIIEKLK